MIKVVYEGKEGRGNLEQGLSINHVLQLLPAAALLTVSYLIQPSKRTAFKYKTNQLLLV